MITFIDDHREVHGVDAYFALKSFSYYPRGYQRADFDTDVRASDPAMLPFSPAHKSVDVSK